MENLNKQRDHLWSRGAVVSTAAQLHSTKPELRFCAGSNPTPGVSEIRDGEDLWQWSRLEIRLNAFHRSTIPQKQIIIIIITSGEQWVNKAWSAITTLLQVFSVTKLSHVTKSRVFKNLNLRRIDDYNFRGNSVKNHFRHLKLYSNPPLWLARSRHMGKFWKTEGWSSNFWDSRLFRFCYVEIQRRHKSTKTDIST